MRCQNQYLTCHPFFFFLFENVPCSWCTHSVCVLDRQLFFLECMSKGNVLNGEMAAPLPPSRTFELDRNPFDWIGFGLSAIENVFNVWERVNQIVCHKKWIIIAINGVCQYLVLFDFWTGQPNLAMCSTWISNKQKMFYVSSHNFYSKNSFVCEIKVQLDILYCFPAILPLWQLADLISHVHFI